MQLNIENVIGACNPGDASASFHDEDFGDLGDCAFYHDSFYGCDDCDVTMMTKMRIMIVFLAKTQFFIGPRCPWGPIYLS